MWIGNALWLDFVNTRYIDRGRSFDVLASFGALVDWLVEAGALPLDAAREAVERWEGTPEGDAVLREAFALRTALRELAQALATQSDAPGDAAEDAEPGAAEALSAEEARGDAVRNAVDAINRVFRTSVCYAELSPPPEPTPPEVEPKGTRSLDAEGAGSAATARRAFSFRRLLRPTDADPRRLLALVGDSASDFLCGQGDPALVRRCGNPKCVLYFYDTTKNHNRRFCSPAICGNRVKAAARYRRQRGGRSA
jgi:predicted RNA-binding Zn ribbon-like protein